MRNVFRYLTLVGLMLAVLMVNRASGQSGNLIEVIRADGNLSEFNTAINRADLGGMYSSSGPFTIFAPTNAAFATLQNASLTDDNNVRQTLLYHTAQGNITSAELGSMGSIKTALGKVMTFEDYGNIIINGNASIVVRDVQASNGVIHLIDVVLDHSNVGYGDEAPVEEPAPAPPAEETAPPTDDGYPAPEGEADNGGTPSEGDVPAEGDTPAQDGEAAPATGEENGAETAPPPSEEPAPAPKGMPISNLVLVDPSQNPAFVGGGSITYWAGVNADSSLCKGTTWVLMKQMDGVSFIGSDRKTNPYRGDTACGSSLPLLCLNRNYAEPPATSSRGENYYDGWAGGEIRATVPVAGSALTSIQAANDLCTSTFGHQFRALEFHDASYGVDIGEISGWDLWAYGGLHNNQRYWIYVNDQPANPWNSVQPRPAPEINTWVDQIYEPGGDPAYVHGDKMMPDAGVAAGRGHCKGVTWVIQRQIDGLVQVGSDAITNPYRGDTNCNERIPLLCIRVDGYAPPANTHGLNYAEGWSGGSVALTYPISGHEMSTRENARQQCVNFFGTGWRPAEFHDGSLGIGGTDGWDLWAYGALNSGRRFWITINDQPANPWNPHSGG